MTCRARVALCQLGCVVCTLACGPVLVVWWYTEDIVRLTGVAPAVVSSAGEFARYSLPRLWPQTMYYCFKMYLSSQKIVGVDLVRADRDYAAVAVPTELTLTMQLHLTPTRL